MDGVCQGCVRGVVVGLFKYGLARRSGVVPNKWVYVCSGGGIGWGCVRGVSEVGLGGCLDMGCPEEVEWCQTSGCMCVVVVVFGWGVCQGCARGVVVGLFKYGLSRRGGVVPSNLCMSVVVVVFFAGGVSGVCQRCGCWFV